MSNLNGRVKRLHARTHTFVTPNDLKTVVRYLQTLLAEAHIEPEELEAEWSKFFDITRLMSGESAEDEIGEFLDRNPYFFVVKMHGRANALKQLHPEGYWARNDDEILEDIRDVRSWSSKT